MPTLPLPDKATSDRFDYLGNVIFHCDKAETSLEFALANLDRAASTSGISVPALDVSQQRAAIVAAITSQQIARQFARDERYTMRQQFSFGY